MKKYFKFASLGVIGATLARVVFIHVMPIILANYGAGAVYYVHVGAGGGTGFVMRAKSGQPVFVTNSHVCSGKKVIEVSSRWGKRHTLLVVLKDDPSRDICIAEAPADSKTILEVADDVNIGDITIVAGHPKLRPLELSYGEVIGRDILQIASPLGPREECKGEVVPTFFGLFCLNDMEGYTISNKIEPGNSGSPVLDKWGKVNGIVFAGSDRLGIMVPLEYLKRAVSKY